MSLSPSAARDAIALIEGFWKTLDPTKAGAFEEWLLHTPASEAEVRTAITKLYDEGREFAPAPKHVRDALKASGALGDPILGTGDPRVIARMKQRIHTEATGIAAVRHCSYREALEAIRGASADLLSEYEQNNPDQKDDVGFYRDRVTSVDSLLRDRGVA